MALVLRPDLQEASAGLIAATRPVHGPARVNASNHLSDFDAGGGGEGLGRRGWGGLCSEQS